MAFSTEDEVLADDKATSANNASVSSLLLKHEVRFQEQLDLFLARQEQIVAKLEIAAEAASPQRVRSGGNVVSYLKPRLKGSTSSLPTQERPDPKVKFKSNSSLEEVSNPIGLPSLFDGSTDNSSSHRTWWRFSNPEHPGVYSEACGGGHWTPSNTGGNTMLNSLLSCKGWFHTNKLGLHPIGKAAMQELDHQKNRFQRAIMSSWFDSFCAVMIFGNAFLLGWQVEWMSRHNTLELPPWNSTLQILFTTWFVVELFLRMWSSGLKMFAVQEWEWNLFDTIIIGISLLEFVLDQTTRPASTSQFGVFRILRIMRLVRVIRIVRVIRLFSDLRMMVYSSLKSLKPFACAMILLLMLVYMFSVHVAQAVAEYKINNPDEDLQAMTNYWGSLPGTMYTLFHAISGGISWRNAADELIVIHWSYSIWMSTFVSFTCFAVLNIITGIFVGTAMQCAQEDQDVVIADAMSKENSYAQQIMRIFREADTNHDGLVDAVEFNNHLQDRRVKAYLKHLGLEAEEARGLFRLLDMGSTGRVDMKEFVLGCMRLKGPAKNVDMATLLYENKKMAELWSSFMVYVEGQFLRLSPEYPTISASSASGDFAVGSVGTALVTAELAGSTAVGTAHEADGLGTTAASI